MALTMRRSPPGRTTIWAVGMALMADVIEPTDVRAISCHPLSS
jgi:hypothetical protein